MKVDNVKTIQRGNLSFVVLLGEDNGKRVTVAKFKMRNVDKEFLDEITREQDYDTMFP